MTNPARSRRRLLIRLAYELSIIFLGVSAAFVVDDLRQSREERRHVTRLTEVLLEHLESEDSVQTGMVARIRDGLEDWRMRLEQGERPIPYTFQTSGALGPPVGVWEAVSESDAADLLDPKVLLQIADYYNEIDGTAKRFLPHNSFAEFEILPRVAEGPDAFYDASGHLAPEYAGYMDRVRDMTQYMERNLRINRDLQAALRELLDR